MWFGRSNRRPRRRRKPGRNSGQFFLRVNTSAQKRRDRRVRVARYVFMLIGLACALFLLRMGTRWTARLLVSDNDLFRIRRYEITCYGDVIKADHVIEYASLNTYSNLFAVDIGAVRDHLLSTVPRIQSVKISRRLNGVLKIEVHERMPLARLAYGRYGNFMELDGEGYVLGPSSPARDLPVILGYQSAGLKPGVFLGGTPVMGALEVLEVCEFTPIGQAVVVQEINVGRRNALTLRLVDGAVVLLAWEEMGKRTETSRRHLERKLVQLADNMREAGLRGARIAEIDMTVEQNFPARWVPR